MLVAISWKEKKGGLVCSPLIKEGELQTEDLGITHCLKWRDLVKVQLIRSLW